MTAPLCLAVDGHDGSGKTTLALGLAELLGVPYCRPFAGRRGTAFLAAAEAGAFEDAVGIADDALYEALALHAISETVVCDRFWITVLSVLPVELYPTWTVRPPSLLCWCDLPTTQRRLSLRRERQELSTWHKHYLGKYLSIAADFDCPIIRTDLHDVPECLRQAHAWALAQTAGAKDETQPL